MPKFKVYVTSNEVPSEALRILSSVGSVTVNPTKGPPARESLLKEIEGVDAIFCLLTEKIDPELLDRAKKLKVVGIMAVGYDNIDVDYATKKHVLIANTPGVLTETVADATMALMLATARRIVEADGYVRRGEWVTKWSPMMMVGKDVFGKTLGIYGLGRIGAAVARRALGFGMSLVYHDHSRKEQFEKKLPIRYLAFEELLRKSDFVSIHVPLVPETRHKFSSREFSLMKRTACIINTARGQIIDENALIEALRRKMIAGAGLDVFEEEPISRKNPLLGMKEVVVLPHIASASIETRTAMAVRAARNILAALKNQIPPDLINRDALSPVGRSRGRHPPTHI